MSCTGGILSNGSHSNEAKLALLEKRLQGCGRDWQSNVDEANYLNAGDKAAPKQELSPAARMPPLDSDEELDGNSNFGIVGHSDPRPSKRIRSEDGTAEYRRTPEKPQQAAGRSASPSSWVVQQGAASAAVTPLKEKNSARTPPDAGKRSYQQKKHGNTIERYFHSRGNEDAGGHAAAHGDSLADRFEAQLAAERQKLLSQFEVQRDKADADRTLLELCLAQERGNNADLRASLNAAKDAAAVRAKEAQSWALDVASRAALAERDLLHRRLEAEGSRLGHVTTARTGSLGLREVWEDGQAFQDIVQRQALICKQRETIEAARKAARKRLPLPEQPAARGSLPRPCSATQPEGRLAPEEYVELDEALKTRLASHKRDEDALSKERERLEVEKQRHLRELKRVKDEEGSRLQCGTVLSKRYLLQRLLGRGGFSEVFQAYDVEGLREVAVKVHQLNGAWTEAKKESYVRHATREFNIHRELKHPRIVALLDIFELDSDSFAMVMEFCPGGDLDTYLKEHVVLPEKEARVIISQIFQGLAYLNNASRADGGRIIHYDLKPGNILFDSLGQVKITDFGLSKIAEEGATQGMELTSQGAGTYWYLPAECFEVGSQPPMISNKVDVWSAGVILFQMLYGKRPFGEGLSQERVLREDVMLGAREVVFPDKKTPAVSQECKDFISRCLAYRQQDRVDVLTAAADPFLKLKRLRRESNIGS